MSKTTKLSLAVITIIIAVSGGIYFWQQNKDQNPATKLKIYSDENYTFEYPSTYQIEEGTGISNVIVKKENGYLDIFRMESESGDKVTAFGFEPESNTPQKIDNIENDKTWINGWMYYNENDKETENELIQIFSSIELEDKKTALTKINEDERFIYYEGIAIVKGRYSETKPGTIFGEKLCFTPGQAYKYQLPGKPLFCFENQENAKKAFEINDSEIFKNTEKQCFEGTAEIKISNYKVDKKEAAVRDNAVLEEIIKKGPFFTGCTN